MMKQTFIRSRQFLVQEGPMLALLITTSLFIRLAIILFWQTYHFPTERSMGIEMGYIAKNLATGEGFKIGDQFTVWMAPLYPYLLSLIFRLFGVYTVSSAIAALILQSLASALVEAPLYLMGKRLFGKPVGIIAGLLWAIHPASLHYAVNFIWSSSLTLLGLVVIIIFFLRLAIRPERLVEATLCGIAIGLTLLSDPVILPFVMVAGLWLLWRLRSRLAATITSLLLMATAAIMLLLPWTMRNYQIFHEFIPVKGTIGVNLWLGNHGPDVNQPTAGLGLWHKIPAIYGEEGEHYLLSLNEVERDMVLRQEAQQFILDQPVTFVKYTLWRIYLFWRLTDFGWSGLLVLPYYSLAVAGIYMSIRSPYHGPYRGPHRGPHRGPQLRHNVDSQLPDNQITADGQSLATLLLLALLALPLPYYFTIASTARFRFPLEAIVVLFVAHGLTTLLSRLPFKTRFSHA
jgi:4-amino-4-deoxy-L-arabinose transferase-like glycosyltransferase